MDKAARQSNYRIRYVKIIENLETISDMPPKERYLYRLMDSVIFHDFETALSGTIEDFQNAQNDNQKNR